MLDFGLGANFEDKSVTDSHKETMNYNGTEIHMLLLR